MSCEGGDGVRRSWVLKFRDAFWGIWVGVRGESSFAVHLVVGAAVVATATVLGAGILEWCVLLMCITVVLMAEMFNTALEYLAKGITDGRDRNIGLALDIASGAVLVASIGASVIGVIVFVGLLR